MAPQTRLSVYITTRAQRDEITAWDGVTLRARVTAPPIEGRANAAIEALVAVAVGLPKSSVRVVSGTKSRHKLLKLDGLEPEQLSELLGRLYAG